METENGQAVIQPSGSFCHSTGQGLSGWFSRGLVIAAAVALVAATGALAVGQHWVAAASLLPLLYLLPCATMMFMCMRGLSHVQQAGAAQTSSRNDVPTADVRT
jgi:hypothetical protein